MVSVGGVTSGIAALFKQVGTVTLLPDVWELCTLRPRAVRTATAAESEEGPRRLAVWTGPHEASVLRSMVFPSGICFEVDSEREEWVRVN